MDIGLHCSVGACSQVDFLPFTCDCCHSVFCLAHRTYDAHECPQAGSKDRRVIDCPLCGNLLHWTTEQDVNVVWERHVQGGECAPKSGASGKPKKPKKPRCGADGCRELLTASNQFQCAKCRQNVCLKHRFESDHDCETVRRSQQRQWGLSRRPSGAAAQQNAKKVAANVVSGTKSAVNSLVQNAKAAGASVSAAATATSASLITTASEECPMCHKKFAYVSQLIAHVNKAHPDTATSAAAAPSTGSAASGGREVCPQCRAEFRDLNALIQHAESAHAGAMAAGAATGGRAAGRTGTGDQDKCRLM
ncbi:hypothetical protein PybrP1_007069 [[Pythium] brassicae (nom. inval.)]|nr:hypothetical protein PybrP1_007069 [[Pythium] brassicae (nom. inval.)]